MAQLRTVIQYNPMEIQNHLRKLRAELASFKQKGDLDKQRKWIGAIAMLEDMHKRGGRKEVWVE